MSIDPITGLIKGGFNLLGGALGGWQAARQNKWSKGSMDMSWQQAMAGDQAAQEALWSMFGPVLAQGYDIANPLSNVMGNYAQPMMDQMAQQRDAIPEYYQNAQGQYYTPEMQDITRRQTEMAGWMENASDYAQSQMGTNGLTPEIQAMLENINPYQSGWGSNSQMALGDVGSNLMGQRGQTAFTQGMQDRGMDAANSGGMNPYLQNAMNQASGTLNNQGQTSTSSALEGQGLDYLSREALLNPEQTAQWAKDNSLLNSKQQQEKVYRQALARGGGPGSMVASGLQNQAMADFGNQTAESASEAMRKALMERQGLGLQQNQMGLSSANAGAGIAAGREGQAYSAIPGTQNSATNFMQSLTGAGLNAGGLENSRMGTGASMANSLLGNQLGYAQTGAGLLGQGQNYALGMGGLYNNIMGTQSGMLNSAFGNQLGANQLGVQAAGSMMNNMNSGWGNEIGMYGQIGQNWGRALDPMQQFAQIQGNLAGKYVDNQGKAYQNAPIFNTGAGFNEMAGK